MITEAVEGVSVHGWLPGFSREINLKWKSAVRGFTASLCLRAASPLTLPSLRLLWRSHSESYFYQLFFYRYICLGLSSPVSTCASRCNWRWSGVPCSPPPFPRSGRDELLVSTRRLCRSCAVLRCPVLKRIYLAAAGYRTGCPRRHEALRTKVRCPGG